MANFIYKVKDENGKAYSGVAEADDIKSLKNNLRDHGWYVIAARPLAGKPKFLFLKRGVGLDNLIMFTHQLSSMLEAGIPMLNALDIIWKQIDNQRFQIIISQLKNKLAQGASISEAFNSFPDVFPMLYRALLSVADVGANLVKILRKLLEYLLDQREFLFKLKRAVTYPVIVICFAIVVVIIMLLWVIPTFQMVFTKIKVELPLFTQIIIKISMIIRTFYFWLAVVLISAVLGYIYKNFSATEKGREIVDRIKLRIFIFGPILEAACISRLVRSLSLLLSGGLPVARSIKVAKATAMNAKFSKALDSVERGITEGATLSASLAETKAFPSFLVEMVSVGEESGTLVEMLERVAVHYEENFDFKLNRFLTLLEPLLIIFVGGMVIFILLAIYLPIMKLWSGLTGTR